MVNGFFLDQVSRGINIGNQEELRRDALDLRQQQFEDKQRQQLLDDANNAINNTMSVASQVITEAKKSGASQDKIDSLISPFVKEIQELEGGLGRDPTAKVNQLISIARTPFLTKADQERKDAIARVQTKVAEMAELKKRFPQATDGQLAQLVGLTKKELDLSSEDEVTGPGIGLDPRGRTPAQAAGDIVTSPLDIEEQNLGALSQEQIDQQATVNRLNEEQVFLRNFGTVVPNNSSTSDFVEAITGDRTIKPVQSVADKKRRDKVVDSIQGKQRLITEFNLIETLVEEAKTGQITSFAVTSGLAGAIREATGIDISGDLPIFEALQTQQSALALRLRNPESGFGLTGNTSQRDLAFLLGAVPGLEKTPEGNLAALILMRAKVRRDLELDSLKLQLETTGNSGRFNKEVIDAWTESHDLFTQQEEQIMNDLVNSAQARGRFGRKPENDSGEDINALTRSQPRPQILTDGIRQVN